MTADDILYFKIVAGVFGVASVALLVFLAMLMVAVRNSINKVESLVSGLELNLEAPVNDLRMALADMRDIAGMGRDGAAQVYNYVLGIRSAGEEIKRAGIRGLGMLLANLGARFKPQHQE